MVHMKNLMTAGLNNLLPRGYYQLVSMIDRRTRLPGKYRKTPLPTQRRGAEALI